MTFEENERISRALNEQFIFTPIRNEKYHCPDCGQYIECCGGTCDKSQSDASREERHNDVWLEYEENEQS